jgi:hypothetical protein
MLRICRGPVRAAAGALVILLVLAVPARAQDTAVVSGTVLDVSGAAVPGATVTLIDERTRSSRTVVTDQRGEFTFRAVTPGLYSVKIELNGFRTYERRSNVVEASAQLDLGKVRLEVGALTEVVSVVAEGTTVETRNSNYTGLLTSNQISQVQTKGRDVMSLLRLLPGVRYEDDIEAMGESFGSQVPNVSGQRRAWNQVTVDGLNGNELSGTNRFASATNLDAIAEVKVLLGSYKAEDGRSGGSNIKVVTKSGGLRYTGSAYYYARRDRWNANTWENKQAGQPTPKYHYDTYGVNVGGPVRIPGLWDQPGDKKLFFFYSMETPQAQQPGGLRRYMMPTALERQGDFSQTVDSAGRLIVIRDPATGQPFPDNRIPKDRWDASGAALLSMLPLPNTLDRSLTGGNYNFIRQETPDKPRWNHVTRVDWKKSVTDAVYVTFNSFTSVQKGSEITAGPEKWGFFDGKYDFGNQFVVLGHNHIFSPTLVNELYGGVRRQTEGFGTATDADMQRLTRAGAGFSVGQFHPELNPLGLLPMLRLGFNSTGNNISETRFQYDNRLGETDHDWLMSATDAITWVKGNHTFKSGAYVEYMRNNEARGGNWMGSFDVRRNTNNPLDTNYAFSNLLLGVFREYTEVDAYRSTRNRHWQAEWYAQDTWRRNRITVDYGARFVWYTPYWQANQRTAAFSGDRYDPAKAPRYYYPAKINGQNVAIDPVTGQVLNEVYVGTFVPGTGDKANGMVPATDSSYPRGFRNQLAPTIEPRGGVAYDLFGDNRTKLHASVGIYHNAVLGGGSQGNLQGPPFFTESAIFNSTLSTFMANGAKLSDRPSSVNGLERDAATPLAYRYAAGVEREVGWGTVVDVSYVGSTNRHLEMQTNINAVPDGVRFLPENVDPRNGRPLPDDFLRPYRGYSTINIRGNWGTANYNSLQIQVNRRYIHGLQFGAAYTYARAYGVGDDDPATTSIYRPLHAWYWAPIGSNQRHNLTINYTCDLPRGQTISNNAVLRGVLGDWQLSGENAWVSGDWDNADLDTTDTFDFAGGTEGARPVVTGDPRLSHGERNAGRWIDTSVFQRPSGRGDIGNEPRTLFQLPGINNWNLALFKNFPLGGPRRAQFRVEAYNVLNTTQFRDIDKTARFDAAGNQVNSKFGQATRARNPRIMQLSLRFNF